MGTCVGVHNDYLILGLVNGHDDKAITKLGTLYLGHLSPLTSCVRSQIDDTHHIDKLHYYTVTEC